jgi:sec-independent protein translocase protein TatB
VFNVGGGELLVVLLLALVFLGPDRLPDAAKKVGRMMGEVRRMTSGFQEEVRTAMDLKGTDDAVRRAEPGPQLIGPPPDLPEPTAPPPAAPSEAHGVEATGTDDGRRDEAGHGDTSAA